MILKSLALETTTHCNARCPMCYAGRDEILSRPTYMLWAHATQIIDQAYELGCREVHPFFTADPFCYCHILNLCEYVAKKGMKLVISTNGDLLSLDALEFLQNVAPQIAWTFSVDYLCEETQKKVRPGLVFDNVVTNVDRALSYAKKMLGWTTLVQGVHLPGTNDEIVQGNALVKTFSQWADEVRVVPDDGRGKTPAATKPSKDPCRSLFEGLSILVDGTAVMCCQDYKPRFPLGNVLKTSVRDVWEGPTLAWARKQHLEGRKDRIAVCSSCSVRY